jgi:ABC-type Fe3+ transport system permease subunit
MAFASLGQTDLPLTPTMIIGIVVLLAGVVAYENWRLTRTTHRSGYHGAGLSGSCPRHRPWQELSPWMRALRVSILICWAVMMIAIETAALRQPKIADATFVHPHEIKGGVRFFTDRQEKIYAAARPLMIGSWAVTLALMVAVGRTEESWRKRKQQDLLDRLATEV